MSFDISILDRRFVTSALNPRTRFSLPQLPMIRVVDVPLPPYYMDAQFNIELLKKSLELKSDVNPDDEAIDYFFACEGKMKAYNENFSKLASNPKFSPVLRRWKHELHKILGDAPVLRYPTKITSGATASCKTGSSPLVRLKSFQITPELRDFISASLPLGYYFPVPTQVEGIAKLKLVPKTCMISRMIILGLSGNLFAQCDIGLQIRDLLRVRGVDTSTAPNIHAELARIGSQYNLSWSTIDLRNANALICTALVKELTPPAWYAYMNAARESHLMVPRGPNGGSEYVHELQMFMSAGNGFCFEFETAIFYSLLKTARFFTHNKLKPKSTKVSAFGDDLICDFTIVDFLKRICNYVGFEINESKSFQYGYFKESCGGDYLQGEYVRPVYLKGRCQSTYDKIVLANQIFSKYSERWTRSIKRTWLLLLRSIPREERLFGPSHYDGVIHSHRFSAKTRSNAWGKTEFLGWENLPTKDSYTSFSVISKGTKLDVVLPLIAGGYMRGWGQPLYTLCNVYDSTQHDSYFMRVRGKWNSWRFLPLPPKSEFILSSDVRLYKLRYEPKPDGGSKFSPVLTWRIFTEFPSGIDETDPLSIFDVLDKTNPLLNTEEVVARGNQRYEAAINALHSVLVARLTTLTPIENYTITTFDF